MKRTYTLIITVLLVITPFIRCSSNTSKQQADTPPSAVIDMDENHLSYFVNPAGEARTITNKNLKGGTHIFLLARTKITEL